MYLYGKIALLRLTPVVYYISLKRNMFLLFLKYFEYMHFKHKHMGYNHKIWGSPCIKFGIIYSNGGHFRFNYTHTFLTTVFLPYICAIGIHFLKLFLSFKNANNICCFSLQMNGFSSSSGSSSLEQINNTSTTTANNRVNNATNNEAVRQRPSPLVDRNNMECCPRCGGRVYFAEEVKALKRKWHKTCFKCGEWNLNNFNGSHSIKS